MTLSFLTFSIYPKIYMELYKKTVAKRGGKILRKYTSNRETNKFLMKKAKINVKRK